MRVRAAAFFGLTLFAAPLRAQDGVGGRSLRERLDAVSTSSELQALVRELAAESDSRSADDKEFGQIYYEAASNLFFTCADGDAPLEETRAAFELARAVAERLGSRGHVAELIDAWSTELLDRQEHAAAEALLSGFLSAADVPVDLAPYLNERHAQAAQARGDFGTALERFERALAAVERMSAPEPWPTLARSAVLVGLAKLEFDLGRLDDAHRHLSAAAEQPIRELDSKLALELQLARAQLALAVWDYDAVAALVSDEWLELARQSSKTEAALALFARAQAHYARTREVEEVVDLTRTELGEVIELARVASREIQLAAQILLANLELRSGNEEAARANFDLVRAAMDGADLDTRVRCAALHADLALAARASRTELEDCSREVAALLVEQLERARSLAVQPSGVGHLHWSASRISLAAWVRLQLALDPREGPARALEPLLAVQAAGSLARALGASAGVREIRETLLAEGVGLLVYLPGPDHSHVFAIDAAGVEHFGLPREFDLRARAAALRDAWELAPTGSGDARAARRAGILDAGRTAADGFMPIELRARMAAWTVCVVSGADLCGDPAFECFVLAEEEYLGLQKALVYAPSLPVAARLRTRGDEHAAGAGPAAVLVAAVDVESDAERGGVPLRPIRAEASALEELVADFGATALRTGASATLEALREPLVARSRVLAILAHGAYDPERCGSDHRPARLLLAPSATTSGDVCCSEIELLDLPPLVELLACGTARGPVRMGDGVAAHLVGACLRGGANAVLAARIEIELGATFALVRRFHSELARGATPAVALLMARRAVSAAGSDDPWYWAGLTLHGDGGVAPFTQPTQSRDTTSRNTWKWIALAAAVVVASALFVQRRRQRRVTLRN